MPESLPYLANPGSIVKCLEKISKAATPEKVTGDFVTDTLAIKGGTGHALPPFLKKIGFVNSDVTPTDLYVQYRNPAKAPLAVAKALKRGYKPLYNADESAHDLSNSGLKGLIVQVTGHEEKSNVVKWTLSTFTKLKALANFAESETSAEEHMEASKTPAVADVGSYSHGTANPSSGIGMNLSYTINLNLPATSDSAVFNAIFKSLKENLLKSDDLNE